MKHVLNFYELYISYISILTLQCIILSLNSLYFSNFNTYFFAQTKFKASTS